MLTTIFAFIGVPASTSANDAAPRITAVAVARAQIISAVRVTARTAHSDPPDKDGERLQSKARERRCPEADLHPCRLFVIDMP